MKCPACESTDITDCSSKDDTIKYCNSCKFQWSTELPLPLLASMVVRYNQEREQKAVPIHFCGNVEPHVVHHWQDGELLCRGLGERRTA